MLASTAIPSSASERSSSRIPSRSEQVHSLDGLVDDEQPRAQREDSRERDAHRFAAVEFGQAQAGAFRRRPFQRVTRT